MCPNLGICPYFNIFLRQNIYRVTCPKLGRLYLGTPFPGTPILFCPGYPISGPGYPILLVQGSLYIIQGTAYVVQGPTY